MTERASLRIKGFEACIRWFMDGPTDRSTSQLTNGLTDRQTNRLIDIPTDGQYVF